LNVSDEAIRVLNLGLRPAFLKGKYPAAPAVKREAEQNLGVKVG
jgi:hypothetical protein